MKITEITCFTIHPGWRKNLIFVKVETDPSGNFLRPAALGVPPGSYAVVVKSGRIMPHPTAEVGQPIRIPARYMSVSSTPFTVEVTKHSSRFDLSLRR